MWLDVVNSTVPTFLSTETSLLSSSGLAPHPELASGVADQGPELGSERRFAAPGYELALGDSRPLALPAMTTKRKATGSAEMWQSLCAKKALR